MHISREKGLLALPDFVSYHKSLSGFLFHDKFLGAVGLVQMHHIEHDSNLVRFLICLRYIPAWNITFQEMRFFHKFYVARITPTSTLLEI